MHLPDLGRRLRAACRCRWPACRSPTSRRSTSRCCKSGATITEMNCRAPAPVGDQGRAPRPRPAIRRGSCNLLLSDVPGDDPIDIASGPTVPDPTTRADALAHRPALRHRRCRRMRWRVLDSARPRRSNPAMPRLPPHRYHADRHAPAGAGGRRRGGARTQACAPASSATPSKARRAMSARSMGGIALQAARHGQPVAAPCVLLSGGETTVTVRGDGPRRAQRGVPARPWRMALRRRARHPRHCGRHRRRRRPGRKSPARCSAPDTLARAWRRGPDAARARSTTTTDTASSRRSATRW